jgi:hypothetical protein
MTQYKNKLIEALKDFDETEFNLSELKELLADRGCHIKRAKLIVDLRSINNSLISTGYFLQRTSGLGRGKISTYTVRKV